MHENTTDSGRYVWAAILIILSVVLAAIAFITWVVNAGDDTAARVENRDGVGYSNTSKMRSGVTSDKLYDYNPGSHSSASGNKNADSVYYEGEDGIGDLPSSTGLSDGTVMGNDNTGNGNSSAVKDNVISGKTEQ